MMVIRNFQLFHSERSRIAIYTCVIFGLCSIFSCIPRNILMNSVTVKSLRYNWAPGAVAAAVWALQEPLDQQIFGSKFSDIAFIGKGISHQFLPKDQQKHWYSVGIISHVINGAVIGAFVPFVSYYFKVSLMRASLGIIMTEHVTTYPLTYITDKYHPSMKDGDVGPIFGQWNTFSQATYRHLLFGVITGLLTRRIKF